MTVADLDDVMSIEAVSYSHPWTRGNFVDSLAARHWTRCVRDASGELVAYCVAMSGVDELHLLNITVAPEHVGRGHARALLDLLVQECRASGAPLLWLEVRPSNERARRLYERYGFELVGVRRGYYPDAGSRREDALVMRLLLESPPGEQEPA